MDSTTPVLVCLYGSGLTPDQGRSQFKKFMQAADAAGFTDQFVLDHYAFSDKCSSFSELIDVMVAKIDEDPKHQGRPLLIVGHSVGALYSWFVMKRLGDRVLKFYPIASRPPVKGSTLTDVWGIDSNTKLVKFDDAKFLKGMINAWQNDFLERFKGKPADQIPPMAKDILDRVREQFSSPFMPLASKEIKAMQKENPADFEPCTTPILAVAGGQEMKLGETPRKVEAWKALTQGSFDMVTVDGDHFSIFTETEKHKDVCVETHNLIIKDMQQFIK